MNVRRTLAALLSTTAAASTLALTAGPASAAVYYDEQTRTVSERSSGMTYTMPFSAGQYAKVSCTGSIWAGVWFTGNNGPDGWANSAPNHFPLPGYKEGRSFGVIGQYRYLNGAAASGYFHIGSNGVRSAPWTSSPTYLVLRTNDDVPGNGSGAFTCTAERWRP